MHHLVDIKRTDLRCPRCGAVAEVASGNSRMVATGYSGPVRAVDSVRAPFLQACEECLNLWRHSHRCQAKAA
jgi:hypothetical protein